MKTPLVAKRIVEEGDEVKSVSTRAGVAAILKEGACAEPGKSRIEDAGLLRAAFDHGVGGLLGFADPRVERGLASIRSRGMVTSRLTPRLVDALEARGVRCCVLKGVAVAAAAWEDPSVRPSGDVDLLVRRDQLEAAERALQDAALISEKTVELCGYHYVGFRAAGPMPVPIDLHWTLSSRVPVEVSARALLERRVWIDTHVGRLPTLGDEDAVVFIGLHAATHCFEALSQLVDLAGYARRRDVDWVEAALRARRWRCELPVYLAWTAARDEVGARIPPKAIGRHRPGMARVAASRALLTALRAAEGKKARRQLSRAFRASLVGRMWELPLLMLEKKHNAARRRETSSRRARAAGASKPPSPQ